MLHALITEFQCAPRAFEAANYIAFHAMHAAIKANSRSIECLAHNAPSPIREQCKFDWAYKREESEVDFIELSFKSVTD
jgi:hypothetical protein